MNMSWSRLVLHVFVLYLVSVTGGVDPVDLKVTSDTCAVSTNWDAVHRDLTLKYLEDKVWDAVVVTDYDSKNNEMAIEEDTLFMKALEDLGRKVKRVSIQNKQFNWATTKSVIIRSAWDKFSYLEDYKRFLDDVNTQSFLFNPRVLIRWQANKIEYMKQLAKYVKVPRTMIIRHTDATFPSYAEVVEMMGCEDLIVKPAQGNSGIGVKKINANNEDLYKKEMEKYWHRRNEDMLIQCFMYSIVHDGPGEINVYMVDGEVTHAGYSVPAKGGYLIHEEYGGEGDDLEPTAREVEYATMVYDAVTSIVGVKPLYFRVDMMYDNDGDLTLMEIACGTTDMAFRDEPEAAVSMAQALDRFLSEKEATYEQVHGHKPAMIDRDSSDEDEDSEDEDSEDEDSEDEDSEDEDSEDEEIVYDFFGTPLRGGNYGRDRLWEGTVNRTTEYEGEQPNEDKEDEASPLGWLFFVYR